jgi:hypothetical protein
MRQLLVAIPLFVDGPRHVDMLRVQSVLGRRLRKELKGRFELTTAVVCDFVADGYESQVDAMRGEFDIFVPHDAVQAHAGPVARAGIRRPTTYAIEVLGRAFPDPAGLLLMRIAQDTFVTDPARFLDDLAAAADCPHDGRYIASAIEHWPTTAHYDLCRRMNLPTPRAALFAQGASMMAPLPVWDRYYLGLPTEIHHRFDDVMMSAWLCHEGGQLIDVAPSFRHMHHCDPVVAQEIYRSHAATA